MSDDLWGDLPDFTKTRTPLEILRDQAALLGEKTKGTIQGVVVVAPDKADGSPYDFDAQLRFVVPGLKNYRYTLLTISYKISELYPIVGQARNTPEWVTFANEQEYLAWLGSVLSSQPTRNVIAALVAQVRGNEKPPPVGGPSEDDIPF